MNGHRAGHLLLGVCGSSAATATADLVADATRYARKVTVVATATAAELFLPELPVPVFTDTHWRSNPEDPLHIRLLAETDWFIVAPATATTLARAAAGIADTLLTALILAHGPGVYFQPSMNQRMWNSPATRRTIEVLTADGHHILEGAPTPTLTSDNPTGGIGAIPGTVLPAAAAHRQRRQR
ncbi:flavoprotein [Streptomyces sp. NPDC089799]|uniref:flavoprotein n=1 Tax=Streptomyces sp. NPDC089799 TaxID=3155066 RepID=UPI0034287DAC